MKARFKPTDPDKYPSTLLDCQDEIYRWRYAFSINFGEKDEVKYYDSPDIKFPSSDVFPETDLEIIVEEK